MKGKPKVTDVNVLFFIFIVMFLLFQVVLLLISAFSSVRYGTTYSENFFTDNMYIITLISEYVIILLPVLVFAYFKKLNFKKVFRINNPGLLPMILIIPASIGAYAVALAVNEVVLYLLQFVGEIPVAKIPVPRNLPELVVGILVIAVTPAICEEFMHRGLLLSAYERRGTKRAIIITALLFGVFHFDITNLFGPIFLGLLIGYYVIRTNSIWPGVFAHFLNNTIAQLLQYFLYDHSIANESITIDGEALFNMLLVGIAGFIFLSLILVAFHAATAKKSRYYPPIASVKEDARSVMTHWPMVIALTIYILTMGYFILAMAMNTAGA